MALKKPTFENEPTSNQGDTAVAEEAVKVETTQVETTQVETKKTEPAMQASMAITKADASSQDSANTAKQFKKEVEEMHGAANFSYGNYDVFKGNNGKISCRETKQSFGRWVKVRLMAWNEHTEVSPGAKGESTKAFVAYSLDGKVVDSVIGDEQNGWIGKPVMEYIDYLRDTEEFNEAKARKFIDTACFVLASDSGDGPIGETVQITLSPSSIPAFAKHQERLTNSARAVAMGLPGAKLPSDPFTFYMICEAAQRGDNDWTKLRIEAELPTRL